MSWNFLRRRQPRNLLEKAADAEREAREREVDARREHEEVLRRLQYLEIQAELLARRHLREEER